MKALLKRSLEIPMLVTFRVTTATKSRFKSETMGKKKDEYGSQMNLVENEAGQAESGQVKQPENDKKATENGKKTASFKEDPITKKKPSIKRCSRENSHEFETVKPESKVLTPDEKVTSFYILREFFD